MKVTRKMLLAATAGLGIFIIVYSLIRQFTGFGFSESGEKYMMDVVIISALGLFMYNRKMVRDEKLAKEAAEEAVRRAEEEPEDVVSPEDETLPHWERNKKTAALEDEEMADDGESGADKQEG